MLRCEMRFLVEASQGGLALKTGPVMDEMVVRMAVGCSESRGEEEREGVGEAREKRPSIVS